ncbi:MAG TPA: hypothetical protein VGI33_00260 [Paenibacillus sp.]|jgi:hypothetical protein
MIILLNAANSSTSNSTQKQVIGIEKAEQLALAVAKGQVESRIHILSSDSFLYWSKGNGQRRVRYIQRDIYLVGFGNYVDCSHSVVLNYKR